MNKQIIYCILVNSVPSAIGEEEVKYLILKF